MGRGPGLCQDDSLGHYSGGTVPALAGVHAQGEGADGPADTRRAIGRRVRTPTCLGARVLRTTRPGSRGWRGHTLRACVGCRRSRVPGHRPGQKFASQRRFDRVFLQKFELDENFPKNESCSVKYPLQLLQRPSYAFLNGLSRNVERSLGFAEHR
jgi:hypothetical protein